MAQRAALRAGDVLKSGIGRAQKMPQNMQRWSTGRRGRCDWGGIGGKWAVIWCFLLSSHFAARTGSCLAFDPAAACAV